MEQGFATTARLRGLHRDRRAATCQLLRDRRLPEADKGLLRAALIGAIWTSAWELSAGIGDGKCEHFEEERPDRTRRWLHCTGPGGAWHAIRESHRAVINTLPSAEKQPLLRELGIMLVDGSEAKIRKELGKYVPALRVHPPRTSRRATTMHHPSNQPRTALGIHGWLQPEPTSDAGARILGCHLRGAGRPWPP